MIVALASLSLCCSHKSNTLHPSRSKVSLGSPGDTENKGKKMVRSEGKDTALLRPFPLCFTGGRRSSTYSQLGEGGGTVPVSPSGTSSQLLVPEDTWGVFTIHNLFSFNWWSWKQKYLEFCAHSGQRRTPWSQRRLLSGAGLFLPNTMN